MIPERIIRLLPLAENKMLNDIGGFLQRICDDIIREKKGGLEKESSLAEHDILSRIIQTNEFTDDEVSNQMLTFLAAGVSLCHIFFLNNNTYPLPYFPANKDPQD